MSVPIRLPVLLAAGLATAAGALHAQSGQSSARAVGMGYSMTAAARGYEAIAWNPALLGTRDRPAWSINILQVGVSARSNVLGPGDLWRYYTADSLTAADKDDILAKVRSSSDSTFGVGGLADLMLVAVTVGPFGIALSGTAADADVAVSDDAVELLLYGNVTRRAPGERYLGAGTYGAGLSAATLAVSWGHGFALPVGRLAVGATAKLRRGILAGRVADLGSFVQNAPNFTARAGYHAVYYNPDSSLSNGSGFGLDLGAVYDFASGIRVAAAVENVFSTMSWNDDKLWYVRQEFLLEQSADGTTYSDSTITDIDERYDPTDATQVAMRDSLLGGDPFATKIRVGARLTAGPVLLAGDATVKLADGIVPKAGQRMSVGAELPLSVVRLRGGVATDFDGGFGISGGLGFQLGPVRLDIAGATVPGGDRKGPTIGFGASVMR